MNEQSFAPTTGEFISKKTYRKYSNASKYLLPFRRKSKNKRVLPIDEAGFFSLITFSWMSKYIYKAYKKGLNIEDIPLGSTFDSCDLNAQRLEKLWQDELNFNGRDKASFGRAVWKFVRTRVLICCLIFSLSCLMGFICPTIFMRKLLQYLEEPNSALITGITWASALISAEIFRTMCFALYYSLSYRTGLRLRSACLGMAYRKILKLNSTKNTSAAEIINLYSFDGSRLYYMVIFGPMTIGGPVIAICGFLTIYFILGPWALLGMIPFALYYPLQLLLARLGGHFGQTAIKASDMRMKLVTEILTNIKFIKMCAWDSWFFSKVQDVRKRELGEVKKIAYCHSIGISLAPTIPVISAIVTFIIHVLSGESLTASQAFSVLVFFVKQMKTSIQVLRDGNSAIYEGNVSAQRFKDFFMLEENITNISNFPPDNHFALIVKDGFFSWDLTTLERNFFSTKRRRRKAEDAALITDEPESAPAEVLHSIDLSVPKGALVGICGSVGAGKSSLLLACLGQLKMTRGNVHRNGTCAYVSQQPWIQNTSLKDNILFGEQYVSEKYAEVVDACVLKEDINMMPDGDEAEIGERGVNLSGGQRQRVSLARALYADKDIYFLDDPLSAVDPSVGQQIFEKYILGALKWKTVILVTNQLQFLRKCDEVWIVKEGKIVKRGNFEDLARDENILEYALQTDVSVSSQKKIKEKTTIFSNQPNEISEQECQILKKGKFTKEEEQLRGTIKLSAYRAYVTAAGGYIVSFFVNFIILFNVGSNVFSSWWLALWIKEGSGNTTIVDPVTNETVISQDISDNPNINFYLRTYASIVALIVATCLIRNFVYTKVTLKASERLHNDLFKKIMESSVLYFERTPLGQIQNLLSRDIDEIDTRLPESMETMLQNIWSVLFSFLSITLVFHWFLIPLLFLACIYYFISRVFRVAIRDLKRMDNTYRSPVFNLISATVQGLPVIHAFNKENNFYNRFCEIFDRNSTIFFLSNNAMRWMAVRLDFISVIITFIAALLVVLLKGEVSAAFAGLALTYAAQICGVFQYTIRLMSENEARFISVERIQTRIEKLTPEENLKEAAEVERNWPSKGNIIFNEVKLSYGEDLPYVLKNISISIVGGEKIGVVGRTGAGKSSLIAALFRLVEPSSGIIYIDGIDITKISLRVLRSRLSVIPQEPTLFSESLKANLDPFNDYSDDDVWRVLEKIKLLDKVKSMSNQLMTHIGEGESLSHGERQLLCLARTLLKNSKIIILDEATASIDPETEIAVQTTIQKEFKDCTVLTIAHRLSTVKNCDRILVIDRGNVVEFDNPKVLMTNPNSQFYKMVEASEFL